MKPIAVLAAVLFALPALAADPTPMSERQFSADLVLTPPNGGPPQTHRLYFSKLRIRTEVNVGGRSMVTLNDLNTDRAWMLMPEQKTAMEMTGAMKAMMSGRQGGHAQPKPQEMFSGITGNPCAKLEGWTCTSLGEEKVDGRPADKWAMADKDGNKSTVWIDRSLHMPIKRQMPDGQTFEMKHIKEGSVPDALFQVPSDYRVMQGMPGGPGGGPQGMGKMPMGPPPGAGDAPPPAETGK